MSVAWSEVSQKASDVSQTELIIAQQEDAYFRNISNDEPTFCSKQSDLGNWKLEENLCSKFDQDRLDRDGNNILVKHTEIFAESLMNGTTEVPLVRNNSSKIAVFNVGILGSCVIRGRCEISSILSMITFPVELKNTVASLREMGFRYIVFRHENTFQDHKFNSSRDENVILNA